MEGAAGGVDGEGLDAVKALSGEETTKARGIRLGGWVSTPFKNSQGQHKRRTGSKKGSRRWDRRKTMFRYRAGDASSSQVRLVRQQADNVA